jgi:ribonuclease P protein component
VERARRITSADDFGRAREQGRAFRDARLVILVRPNGLQTTRFGFITGKRLGKAVVRNRLRRLLREAARSLCADTRDGFDVVIIATRQAVGSSYHAIRESMQALFHRAGLLADEG